MQKISEKLLTDSIMSNVVDDRNNRNTSPSSQHKEHVIGTYIQQVDLYPVDLCFVGSITLFKVNNVK